MPRLALGAPVETLEQIRQVALKSRPPGSGEIRVCCGTGCQARGSLDVLEAVKDEVRNLAPDNRPRVKKTGCQGFCEIGTVALKTPEDFFYCRVKPEDARAIAHREAEEDENAQEVQFIDPATGRAVSRMQDIPFYKKQERLVLSKNGCVDPEDILDCIAMGGYQSLASVLAGVSPEDVIATIEKSGLRGRGGGGFPTGRKWRTCRDAHGAKKYVICNADEGDPGAFMDRSILEGAPHAVLEGMIIGAYAIGARQGFIYVRNEYPLAVERVNLAIAQAGEFGLLGRNILGSDFSFSVRVMRGGGAFVCGESTALMASLQGEVGEPRTKYIHTVESGLWDSPTTLNNVETWANVPIIIEMGAEKYTSIGSKGSKGTKVFSVVGKCKNTGLVEVPMGITLREIVEDICGGVQGNKKLKAIQTGGPSGGCIPASLADLPVDFDSLTEAGSMMGSGGMIVMDEDTCMVDVAKYFTNFLRKESCGKCTPCREGTEIMYQTLCRISKGEGREEDLGLLEEIGETLKVASLCALGQTAANPVLSTIRYFREEYLEHIRNGACPAGVCRDLLAYCIVPELCTGCGKCLRACPSEAITGEKKQPHVIEPEKCIACGVCYEQCAFDAVERKSPRGEYP